MNLKIMLITTISLATSSLIYSMHQQPDDNSAFIQLIETIPQAIEEIQAQSFLTVYIIESALTRLLRNKNLTPENHTRAQTTQQSLIPNRLQITQDDIEYIRNIEKTDLGILAPHLNFITTLENDLIEIQNGGDSEKVQELLKVVTFKKGQLVIKNLLGAHITPRTPTAQYYVAPSTTTQATRQLQSAAQPEDWEVLVQELQAASAGALPQVIGVGHVHTPNDKKAFLARIGLSQNYKDQTPESSGEMTNTIILVADYQEAQRTRQRTQADLDQAENHLQVFPGEERLDLLFDMTEAHERIEQLKIQLQEIENTITTDEQQLQAKTDAAQELISQIEETENRSTRALIAALTEREQFQKTVDNQTGVINDLQVILTTLCELKKTVAPKLGRAQKAKFVLGQKRTDDILKNQRMPE